MVGAAAARRTSARLAKGRVRLTRCYLCVPLQSTVVVCKLANARAQCIALSTQAAVVLTLSLGSSQGFVACTPWK